MNFLECEERLNVELAHRQYDNYFDSEEEWKVAEDRETLSNVPAIESFEDLKGIE